MKRADKILAFETASAHFDKLRARGRRIVQCHGTFDLIHPGHIHHLEEARELGDILVVTITGEKFVNKGPGRPYFNDRLRARSMAALGCVDYVVVVPFPAAVEAIDCVKPHIYCKGREYANASNDVTGNIRDDVAAVKKHGGKVRYLGSVVFSSSKLINSFFENVGPSVKAYCRQLAASVPPKEFRESVNSFASLNVLLIGDIIFDRYSSVKMQGLTSKNHIMSGQFLSEDTQPGGSLAIYRHLKQFCGQVKFISLVGAEKWVGTALKRHVDRQDDWIIRDPDFTTIVKQRYVEPHMTGKELVKLFAVNYLDNSPPPAGSQSAVTRKILDTIAGFDVVVIADFGHGLMHREHRALVEDQARFMTLNCQTNSNNHGFNIISRQYERADAFSLDEQELLLSCARRPIEFQHELESLRQRLSARYAWLTRGAVETIGLCENQPPSRCPPLEASVVDTVGAGDAFFAVTSLAAARQLPVSLGTFLGQLAGSQAVKIIGNQHPISKQTLLKSGMTLLNF